MALVYLVKNDPHIAKSTLKEILFEGKVFLLALKLRLTHQWDISLCTKESYLVL